MKTILILLLLVCNISMGQQVKTEIDKFTGKKRVATEYVNVAVKFTGGIRMRLRTVDTSAFIIFSGSWAVGVVGMNDATTFLFDDKSTLKVYPTSVQSYDIGIGQYAQDSYEQQYFIRQGDLKVLSEKAVVSVRREYGRNYADIDVKEKNANKIKGLVSLVLKELDK